MIIGLRHLFIFTFSVLSSLIIGMGGYLLWLNQDIDKTSKATIHAVKAMESAQNLEEHLFSHKRNYLLADLTGNRSRSQAADESEKALHEDLDILDQLGAYSPKGSPSDISAVHGSIERYLAVHRKLRQQGLTSIELYRGVTEEFDIAYAAAEALIQYNVDFADQNQDALDHLGQVASAIGGGLVLLALFAIGALAFILRKSLFRPLTKLRDAIVEMRQTRSFSVRAPLIGSSDIQNISSCFNELSADLEAQQKSQFRFIATVAHDIKNPLAAMAMSADLLADDIKNQDGQETLGILKRQIAALQNIVKDLLAQSALEAGNIRTNLKEFDLNDLIAKCVSLNRLTASHHHIEFSSLPGEAICLSDPDRINQVMNNLLSNAIKYSPGGGEIRIELQFQNQQYQILVCDNGIGIPAESLQSIFYPFQRVSNAEQSASGTGLGLFSCKRIIKALGGEISVQSTIGKGSTFIVKLPLKYSPQAKSSENSLFEDLGLEGQRPSLN